MRRGLLRQVSVKLVEVGTARKDAVVLYELLRERTADVSISHREMPFWDDHLKFVRTHPYRAWYLIDNGDDNVGSIYLSMQDEIGIFIFKKHQGQGYGAAAIRALMQRYPRQRYLANVNPNNKRSAKLFKHLGFNLLQHTYELR